MPKLKDLTGQKFGSLTVLNRLPSIKGRTKWLCVCDCGNFKEVESHNLQNGHTKSCGCLRKEITIKRNKTHDLSHTRLHNIWTGMKTRCYNKNAVKYPNYGGRGIKVCDEWLNDFMSFYDWAMANGYNDNLTIDRIYVNGNYTPNNCRWITMEQQARNKRNSLIYTIDNETRSLVEWCKLLGLNYDIVRQRIKRYNWTIEKALELE